MIRAAIGHASRHSIAYLALVCSMLALAGASYASFHIPNGSVGEKQLKNHVIDPVKRFTMLDSQDGDFTLATAKRIMTNWITKYGTKIDLVYAHNDGMGDGAYQAVQEAGFTKKLRWGSIDGQNDIFVRIAQGDWDICVTNSPKYGPITWQWVNAYFTGQKVPTRIVPVDVTVTKANAKMMEGQGF